MGHPKTTQVSMFGGASPLRCGGYTLLKGESGSGAGDSPGVTAGHPWGDSRWCFPSAPGDFS